MSAYNGRRGPNVSKYLANLNHDFSNEDLVESPPDFDTDLALFTNSNFYEEPNVVEPADVTAAPFDLSFDEPTATAGASPGQANMDFNIGDFSFAGFPEFNPIVDPAMQSLPHAQPNAFAVPPTFTSPVNTTVSPTSPDFDFATGKKRRLDSVDLTSQQGLDDAARNAAEEDKRRRNTAASARFRVKKKQREQALEKTAKEMTDRVNVLETRINQLETENAWLKSLITEKNGGKATSKEISALVRKREAEAERISGSRNDGVGTSSEEIKA